MKNIHVPTINARYWAAILFASVFGTNLGDLYAHESGLGIAVGLIVLAGLAGVSFVAERVDRHAHEAWYWLVIIIIRTGATNIADFLAFRAHVPQALLVVGLAALIGVFGWLAAPRTYGRNPGDTPLLDTGAPYWTAMLSAGVFGTVLGDVCSHAVGELLASLILLAVFAAALAIRARAKLPIVLSYWSVVAIARTAGTSMGDWLAENHALSIGLPRSTLISGVIFVLILLLVPGRRRKDLDDAASSIGLR